MKKWLNITAAVAMGMMVFTSCTEDEVILTVPADVTIELGATFDPMTGVTVDGADLEDVNYTVVPAWNIYEVNHYVVTYTVEDQTADRNVYISAASLEGNYTVTDTDDGGASYDPYLVTVVAGTEYNELRLSELFYNDIIVNAVVNGSAITIPSQQFFTNTVTIQGTGTYNGETKKILAIDYSITNADGTVTGESVFE